MGGEMTQEEIDAMLNQMAEGPAPAAAEPAPAPAAAPASSGELTQEEIDAMLSGAAAPEPAPAAEPTPAPAAAAAQSATSAQNMQFSSFQGGGGAAVHHDVSMIMDVPMELTVELGRTTMYIKDILDIGPGSVVEINRLAGEPIEMLVNGKVIAKGEVVVIDERFGLRITELLNPTNEQSVN